MSGPGAVARRLAGRARPDRGSITLMLAALGVALIALAGIVIDGGAKLRAAENADAVAQEAARAGAGMVDQSAAYAHGTFVVDQAQAISAARAYLAAGGFRGTVTASGREAIQVRVTITQPTRVLSIIDINSMTSTGSATASLVTGVTGPGA
jgi:Flp pilus assembly protein TadG